ncbi:MAG: UbiX family flavin prenyltransferase [Anaerolineales bacterium]|nr:UbiX family flavin prenyltransferase [Anaerolineales bacterium]
MPKRVILAITGASGAVLGIRTLELLNEAGIETHLVVSQAARQTLPGETGRTVAQVAALAAFCYDPGDIAAQIASGSFVTEGMLVVPCSIKTLSGIANSYSDNLVVRAADVCLKEGRPLLLAVRETPLHRGHLRLMQLAAEAGAVIFPPIPSFYGGPQTVDDLVTNLAGRILLRLGIANAHYSRWEGDETFGPERRAR